MPYKLDIKVTTLLNDIPVFAGIPVVLALVLDHLGVVLKGLVAEAACSRNVGALVDDLDVV